ncbi:hypothetical protein OZ410_00070 [Robiginitalea sp. M366]|uniref:hypothetical protein n=1 Tax=Robiginitalea aestuariiviva TaxID=3036903 RepID=UPI00240E8F63|nr:hypothetical protein [Robiginitalea aestuariiviva]MDG1570695.1 hypothetical protein [Robiginitalea aestuariiviva]
MKKTQTLLVLILAGTVTFSAGLWLYAQQSPLGIFEISVAALVFVVTGFSVVVALRRMKDEKKGLPAEDELSRGIKQRAAASAFAGSFYLWTAIAVFVMDSGLRPEIPLEIGLLGMALLFVGFWIYYSKTGSTHANPD